MLILTIDWIMNLIILINIICNKAPYVVVDVAEQSHRHVAGLIPTVARRRS